jgi:hypothetical protein
LLNLSHFATHTTTPCNEINRFLFLGDGRDSARRPGSPNQLCLRGTSPEQPKIVALLFLHLTPVALRIVQSGNARTSY